MKTIAISDLHGLLPEIVEPADIMFICGDISPLHIQFNKPEMWKWLTGEFMDWIIGLPVEKVYLVAGNHDAFFEGASTSKKVELSFLSSHKLIYLENELVYYVDNDGITWSIFGTPYCHQYGNWPFMRTDAYMEEKFKEIPDEVNFILTHDTPYGWKNQDVILELVYNFINQLRFKYKDCVPNLAHYDIAELEKKYEVVVITQNVDTLHEQAGSTNVIHLHGNLNEVRAVDNDNLIFTYPYEGITPNTEIEGHKIRPHIVLFGENVPMIGIAAEELTDADICVVVGTSFNVYPAADLIQYVPYGNPIYYIDPNPAPTPEYPDIKVIKATATEGMKQLIKILEK